MFHFEQTIYPILTKKNCEQQFYISKQLLCDLYFDLKCPSYQQQFKISATISWRNPFQSYFTADGWSDVFSNIDERSTEQKSTFVDKIPNQPKYKTFLFTEKKVLYFLFTEKKFYIYFEQENYKISLFLKFLVLATDVSVFYAIVLYSFPCFPLHVSV